MKPECLYNYIFLAVTGFLSSPCGVIGIKGSMEVEVFNKQRAALDYSMSSRSSQEYSFTVMQFIKAAF